MSHLKGISEIREKILQRKKALEAASQQPASSVAPDKPDPSPPEIVAVAPPSLPNTRKSERLRSQPKAEPVLIEREVLSQTPRK